MLWLLIELKEIISSQSCRTISQEPHHQLPWLQKKRNSTIPLKRTSLLQMKIPLILILRTKVLLFFEQLNPFRHVPRSQKESRNQKISRNSANHLTRVLWHKVKSVIGKAGKASLRMKMWQLWLRRFKILLSQKILFRWVFINLSTPLLFSS